MITPFGSCCHHFTLLEAALRESASLVTTAILLATCYLRTSLVISKWYFCNNQKFQWNCGSSLKAVISSGWVGVGLGWTTEEPNFVGVSSRQSFKNSRNCAEHLIPCSYSCFEVTEVKLKCVCVCFLIDIHGNCLLIQNCKMMLT